LPEEPFREPSVPDDEPFPDKPLQDEPFQDEPTQVVFRFTVDPMGVATVGTVCVNCRPVWFTAA
jgi:hypothetical protein